MAEVQTEEALQKHWANQKERVHSNRPILLLIWLINHLPFWMMIGVCWIVAVFYWIFAPKARKAASDYQKNLKAFSGGKAPPRRTSFRQLFSFCICVVEKIGGWSGKVDLDKIIFHDDDIVELKNQLSEGKGALLIGSHLGNIELLRCLSTYDKTGVDKKIPVLAIMDIKVTATFNQTLSNLNPLYDMDILPASEIGIDTVGRLQDTLDAGGLVVIAGDRTSASAPQRSLSQLFLGKETLFPYGTFFLASLLKCPIYFVFALRKKTVMANPKYNMFVKKSDITFDCGRKERAIRSDQLCKEFVLILEKYAAEYPYQWYNFYDFWAKE